MAIVIGNIYTVEITGMNHEGNGVARIGGEVVFVEQGIKGELMEIRVQTKRKGIYWAEIIKILRQSPCRVAAFCGIYHACGGCGLQHLNYEGQLHFKRDLVINALQRIAKLPAAEELVLPVKGMQQPLYYRNKVMLAAGKVQGQTVLRFQQAESHALVSECCSFLYPAAMQAVQKGLEQVCNQYGISAENGLLGAMLRYSSYSGNTQIILIANQMFGADRSALVEAVKAISPNISGIGLALHKENTAADMLAVYRGVEMLWGALYIEEKIGTKQYRLGPASFFQVNTLQAEVLYEQVKNFAALQGNETVIDAYCGTGTIGIYVGDKAAKLIGIDVVKDAIADAHYNAEKNGVQARFHVGRAEVLLPQLVLQGLQADVVILDPPRKGCDAKLLQALAEIMPQKIIYVSCDPATLARDARILIDAGYQLQKVQPVDMFPQTAHVEVIVGIQRSDL